MKVGPPIVKLHLMYCDHGVLRFLRSAGGPIAFGPASIGATDAPMRFIFAKSLDPNFQPSSKLWLVLWKHYDNGLVTQAVSLEAVDMDGPITDGSIVRINASATLDKRQWLQAVSL